MRLALDARKLTDFGIGTYLAQLTAGLATKPEVALVILGQPGHEERIAKLAPEARFVPVSADGYSVQEHLRIPAALWRERVDLVHFPHYVVPVVMPWPMVVTVHDVIQIFYPPRGRSPWARLYVRLMMRSALRRASAAITGSRAARRDLVSLFGVASSDVTVVPHGVEQAFAERPDTSVIDSLKERYGLRPPLTLVVSNDKPHKNLDLVLRAFNQAVRRHGLPGQLVFVGGLDESSALGVRARRLGLGDRVRFLTRIPTSDLRALYHVAAVLLHVALYEGFGLPIIEAMCAGLPVITSNLGAMLELGEGVALLVNPLDVDEVAASLAQVLVDDPLRRRMIEAGRKRAESHSWERMVDGTMAAYAKALGEG